MTITQILNHPLYLELPWLYSVIFIMIGAALGSFFNVLSVRWPAHQIATNDAEAYFWLKLRKKKIDGAHEQIIPSLMGGRSHCPHCDAAIPLHLNIPIVSWLMLRGSSLCCKKPIRVQYLAFELWGALVFGIIAVLVGPTAYGLMLGIVCMLLALVAVLDYQQGFIPDQLLFVTGMMVLLLSVGPHWVSLETAFIAYVSIFMVTYGVFRALAFLLGKEALSIADIHLLAIGGALIGSQWYGIIVFFVPGLIVTSILVKKDICKRGIFVELINKNAIPAGPAIVFGVYMSALITIQGWIV